MAAHLLPLVHAAVLAINQAIEKEVPTAALIELMKNPAAGLIGLTDTNADEYRTDLINARKKKVAAAARGPTPPPPPPEDDSGPATPAHVPAPVPATPDKSGSAHEDVYDENLTQVELQHAVAHTNAEVIARHEAHVARQKHNAIVEINDAVDAKDVPRLLAALQAPLAAITDVDTAHGESYLDYLAQAKAALPEHGQLLRPQIQHTVSETNRIVAISHTVQHNTVVELYDTLKASQIDLQLPELDESAIELYKSALLAAIAANGGRPVLLSPCLPFSTDPYQLTLQQIRDIIAEVNACTCFHTPTDLLVLIYTSRCCSPHTQSSH